MSASSGLQVKHVFQCKQRVSSVRKDFSGHFLKILPIIVRYFIPKGVQNKFFDFVNEESEKAKMYSNDFGHFSRNG